MVPPAKIYIETNKFAEFAVLGMKAPYHINLIKQDTLLVPQMGPFLNRPL